MQCKTCPGDKQHDDFYWHRNGHRVWHNCKECVSKGFHLSADFKNFNLEYVNLSNKQNKRLKYQKVIQIFRHGYLRVTEPYRTQREQEEKLRRIYFKYGAILKRCDIIIK